MCSIPATLPEPEQAQEQALAQEQELAQALVQE